MQNKKWKLVVVLLLILSGTIFYMNKSSDRKLTVALVMPPKSTDPMEYDYSIHHNTMRSVMASLVSEYKNGEFAPQVAKGWRNNSNLSEWTLEIDPDWSFENGDKITPEIVLKNFKRVLILKNKQNSKSGLLEFLIDSEKMTRFSDNIRGLEATSKEVIFRFKKPMPDFLDKVSFGIYSIAHPDNYNEDGMWKDHKKVIASSYYKILSWNDKYLELELRANLHPEKLSSKNIQKIKFIFPSDMGDIEDSQMIFSDRLSNKIDETAWQFASSTLDNKIIYIQVMNWDDDKSRFSDVSFRRKLRNIFYKNLYKAGMKPMTSFFPLSINGVEKSSYDEDTLDLDHKHIRTQPFVTSDYRVTGKKKSQADIFAEAFYGMCSDINAVGVINDYPEKMEDEKKVFDIQYLGTGVSITNPREDIKFMFQSKQGIMLPDSTGEITKILSYENFNIQHINQLLWDQAIIWPVKHYSSGFWYKRDSGLDLSELNILLTPTDFQFLKWAN